MRRLLILLLVTFGITVLGHDFALGSGLKCSDLNKSTEDTVRVPSFKAKPGGIIKMPLFVTNKYPVGAFRLSVQFDTTKMTPVLDPVRSTDSLPEIVFSVASRFFKKADTTWDEFGTTIVKIDTITKGECTLLPSQKPGDPSPPRMQNVITFVSLPQYNADSIFFDTVDAGRGIIAYVQFQLKPNAVHNDTILFYMYRTDLMISIGTNQGLPDTLFNGCYGCDFLSFVPTGTDTADVQTYPTIPVTQMRMVLDSNYVEAAPPSITSFTAAPSTIAPNGSSTLSWVATNADSVVLKAGTTRITKSTVLSSSYQVSNIAATTTYSLIAYGANAVTDQKNTTVTVSSGGTGNPPVVTTPNSSYSINEGETVGFTVTASDPDGGNISLVIQSPSPLPSGVLWTVISPGPTPITGNFNWTPTVGQHGTYNFVFTSSDGVNTGQRTVTIIVNELQYDRLFSTSTPPPKGKPVGGLKGTTGVLFPINLISSQKVYGIQFDMDYPQSIIRLDSMLVTDRIPDYIVYDNIGVTPGTVRIVTFGMNNDSVVAGSSTAILRMAVTIDSAAVPWTDAHMHMKNGRESVDPNPNVGSLPLVTDTTGIIEIDSLGDVNLDRYIDVADIVNIVAHIIGTYDLVPDLRRFSTADCVVNDTVDVFDLVADINAIYGIPLPVGPSPAPAGSAIAALDYNDLSAGQSQVLRVTSELPDEVQVAGVEMEVDYDPNAVQLGKPVLTDIARRFALQYNDNGAGKLKVLLYHMAPILKSNELIQGGQTAQLVNIPMTAKNNVEAGDKTQLRLTQLLLSTPNAGRINVEGVDQPTLPASFMLRQNYPNPFNPTTKIEFSISGTIGNGSTREVKLEIFNVLGQTVRTLVDTRMSAGPHTVEWDATSDSGERIASGIYLYRLTVGSESQTRKMVFLK